MTRSKKNLPRSCAQRNLWIRRSDTPLSESGIRSGSTERKSPFVQLALLHEISFATTIVCGRNVGTVSHIRVPYALYLYLYPGLSILEFDLRRIPTYDIDIQITVGLNRAVRLVGRTRRVGGERPSDKRLVRGAGGFVRGKSSTRTEALAVVARRAACSIDRAAEGRRGRSAREWQARNATPSKSGRGDRHETFLGFIHIKRRSREEYMEFLRFTLVLPSVSRHDHSCPKPKGL